LTDISAALTIKPFNVQALLPNTSTGHTTAPNQS